MIKVMLAEDSDVVREVLRRLVTELAGFCLTGEFCCASSAIAGVRRDPPNVLLLDIELREGKGMDVLNMAAAEYPTTRVIVVSNYVDTIYRTHYTNAGAYGFYDKSRELGALRKRLESLAGCSKES